MASCLLQSQELRCYQKKKEEKKKKKEQIYKHLHDLDYTLKSNSSLESAYWFATEDGNNSERPKSRYADQLSLF